MTRTEADISATIAASADVVVHTDAFVSTIKRRHRRRRRLQLAVAGGVTAVLAIGVGVPAALLAGRTGPDDLAAVPTGPVGGWATMPRTFTGACTIETIPTPLDVEPGHPVWLTNVDPSGRYVVGTYGPPVSPDGSWGDVDGLTGRALPVRWDNGIGRVIPIGGDGLRDTRPTAVNRHGAVVGSLRRGGIGVVDTFGAWVSLDGTTWSLLPTPPGYDDAYAIGITDDNTVLGGIYSHDAGADAVVWTLDGNGGWRAHVLSTERRNDVFGITDDRWVVGTTVGVTPHVWSPDGGEQDLPTPDGTTWGRVTQVRGDWAIGFVGQADADRPLERVTTHVVRWNLRTGELSIVGDRPESDWYAAINARGDVAWRSPAGAVLVRDGQTYELPRAPWVAFGNLAEPVAINDDATLILGTRVVWWC